jgi:hypothetical protein
MCFEWLENDRCRTELLVPDENHNPRTGLCFSKSPTKLAENLLTCS